MTGKHPRSCPTCPWSGSNYYSANVADAAVKRHTCQRHLDAASKSAAHRARVSSTRTPQACPHKQAKHLHGTWLCYKADRCRCRPCTDAEARYQAHSNRQKAYGRWEPMVDAEPVRVHVQALRDAGMPLYAIAETAGVSDRVTARLMYTITYLGEPLPPSKTVRTENADALLAVEVNFDHARRVPAIGAVRRLQSLVAIGYSVPWLAQQLGCQPGNVHRFLRGPDSIYRTTHDRIVALYRVRWFVPAEPQQGLPRAAIDRARAFADERGFASPLAWDEGALDDPDATPDTGYWDGRTKRLAA